MLNCTNVSSLVWGFKFLGVRKKKTIKIPCKFYFLKRSCTSPSQKKKKKQKNPVQILFFKAVVNKTKKKKKKKNFVWESLGICFQRQ